MRSRSRIFFWARFFWAEGEIILGRGISPPPLGVGEEEAAAAAMKRTNQLRPLKRAACRAQWIFLSAGTRQVNRSRLNCKNTMEKEPLVIGRNEVRFSDTEHHWHIRDAKGQTSTFEKVSPIYDHHRTFKRDEKRAACGKCTACKLHCRRSSSSCPLLLQ